MSYNDLLIVSYNGADLVDSAGDLCVTEEWFKALKQLSSLIRYWPRHGIAFTLDPKTWGYNKCGEEWEKMMLLAANTLSESGITVIDCTEKLRKMVINTQPDRHYADMQLTPKCLWWAPRFSASWMQLLRDIHQNCRGW